jgi:GAF domain-containing protein
LRKVVSGMAADAGVLVLQEDAELVAKAAVGFGAVQTEGVTVRRGQGLAGAVMGGRDAIRVDDVDADYRVEEPYIKAAGLRSMVAVPVLSGDRVIGAVEVGYRNPHTFTDAEVQRLEVMARRTTQALEHERALEDVRRNTMGLEAKLAEQMESEAPRIRSPPPNAGGAAADRELQRAMRMQVSPRCRSRRSSADHGRKAKRVRPRCRRRSARSCGDR